MQKAKLIAIGAIIVLVLIVVLQNLESVDTRLLFATVSMPRALLLLIVFAMGFLGGLLVRLGARNAETKAG